MKKDTLLGVIKSKGRLNKEANSKYLIHKPNLHVVVEFLSHFNAHFILECELSKGKN